MDEPQDVVAPVSETGTEETQPNPLEERLRALQSTKDREIANVQAQNMQMAARLEQLEKQNNEARIGAIEDPDERANQRIQLAEAQLARREQAIQYESEARARPIVLAMIAQQYEVPAEALASARSAVEMENLALKYKLEHTSKDLEKVKKPSAPAAVGQKFAQGAGSAPSTYDPAKFRGTGDLAGSLRAKREAGL